MPHTPYDGQVAACPPITVTDLPEGWSWWDTGIMYSWSSAAGAATWQGQPGEPDRTIMASPAEWYQLDGNGLVARTVRAEPGDVTGWHHRPARWLVLPDRYQTDEATNPCVYDLNARVARAAPGTIVPAGWELRDDPDPQVPWPLTYDRAVDAAEFLRVGPSTDLTTLVVRRQPSGRWSYARGTGGHMVVMGEADTETQAEQDGVAALAVAQAAALDQARGVWGPEVIGFSPWPAVMARPRVIRIEPVGAVEIAGRLGVSRQTVDQWRQRDLGFPAPEWTVGGRPAWSWATVQQWARETGRL